jgi:hypothetical protein
MINASQYKINENDEDNEAFEDEEALEEIVIEDIQ